MLAAEPPILHHIYHPKPAGRRPLQPKNIISSDPLFKPKPGKDYHVPPKNESIKPNPDLNLIPMGAMDSSLAEELSAVKRKLERLSLDREKTEKMLIDRVRILDTQMAELELRGEFQKDLEIEVDRLYRVKELKVACMRRSPIRSLREKEMEKKNKEAQSEGAKTGESKEELIDQSSSTESPVSSFENSSASTSASTSNSTTNSRKSPIPLRWSLGSESDT